MSAKRGRPPKPVELCDVCGGHHPTARDAWNQGCTQQLKAAADEQNRWIPTYGSITKKSETGSSRL